LYFILFYDSFIKQIYEKKTKAVVSWQKN